MVEVEALQDSTLTCPSQREIPENSGGAGRGQTLKWCLREIFFCFVLLLSLYTVCWRSMFQKHHTVGAALLSASERIRIQAIVDWKRGKLHKVRQEVCLMFRLIQLVQSLDVVSLLSDEKKMVEAREKKNKNQWKITKTTQYGKVNRVRQAALYSVRRLEWTDRRQALWRGAGSRWNRTVTAAF